MNQRPPEYRPSIHIYAILSLTVSIISVAHSLISSTLLQRVPHQVGPCSSSLSGSFCGSELGSFSDGEVGWARRAVAGTSEDVEAGVVVCEGITLMLALLIGGAAGLSTIGASSSE